MCLIKEDLSDCKMTNVRKNTWVTRTTKWSRSVRSMEGCQNLCQKYDNCYHFSFKVIIHFIMFQLSQLYLNDYKGIH